MAIFFLLFLLRTLLRKDWLAALAFMGLFAFIGSAGSEELLKEAVFWFVIAGSVVFLLLRFGLLAYAMGVFTVQILTEFPISRHISAWYAPSGVLAIVVIVALAIYGFRATLEGRPALAGLLDT